MTISGGADFTLFEVSYPRYTIVIRIFEYSFIYRWMQPWKKFGMGFEKSMFLALCCMPFEPLIAFVR